MTDLILKIIKAKEYMDMFNEDPDLTYHLNLSHDEIQFLYKKLDINSLLTYEEAEILSKNYEKDKN